MRAHPDPILPPDDDHDLLRLALDAVGQGAWRYDISSQRLTLDDATRRLFGLESAEPLGFEDLLRRVVHPEDRDAVAAAARAAAQAEGDGAFQVEHRVVTDGATRWIALHGRAIFVKGKAVAMLGVARDVTSGREAGEALARRETELRESEARLAAALRAGALGVHEFDPRSGALRWDARVRAIWGVEADEPVTFETFVAGLHPEDRAAAEQAVAAALQPGGPGRFEATYRVRHRKTGEERWVRADGEVTFTDGVAARLVGTVRDITQEVAASIALRDSEARAQNIIESIDGFLTLDRDFRVTSLNARGAAALQPVVRSVESTLGQVLWDLFPGSYDSAFGVAYRRAMADGVADAFEAFYPPLDAWYDVRCYPTRDGLAIHFLNVTARRRAEAAVSRSEGLLRAFLDHSSSYAFAKDLDGRYILANRYYLEMMGETEAEVLGRTDADRFGPDEPFSANDRIVARERRAISFEESAVMVDGLRHYAISTKFPLFGPDGELIGVGGISTDITDRKQAEAALRESEARFRTITEAMPQMVWSTNANGEADFFNARWREFTGVEVEAVMGLAWRGLYHQGDLDEITRRWSHSVATGDPYEVECRLRHVSGGYRWVLARGVPMRDESGEVVRWFGTCTDIHEMRRAQDHRQLLVEELNHRVKNTLAIVQSIAWQSLRGEDGASPRLEAFLGRLRALASAHDLLTKESWEQVGLGDLVAGARDSCAISPERFVFSGPAIVLTPKQGVSVAMALHELCTNALKYGALSSAHGAVRVDWSLQGRKFDLSWRETDGPPVRAPEREGFGLRMIRRALAADLDARVEVKYLRTGLQCQIEGRIDSHE